MYHSRVIIVAAFVLLVNIFFVAQISHILFSRSAPGRKASIIKLALAALPMAAITVIKPVLIYLNFFFVLYYFILFTKRLSGAWKFWISVILFQIVAFNAIPYAFLLFSRPDERIVGLHFFNFFYALPFIYLGRLPWLESGAMARSVSDFVSSQALFGLRFVSGTTLLASLGFSYGMIRHLARYSEMRGVPDAEHLRLPWIFLPFAIVGAILFYLLPKDNVIYPYIAFIWPALLAFYAARGLVLGGALLGHIPGGGSVLFILFFSTVLLEPVFFLFGAAGAMDSALGIGMILRRPEAVRPRGAPLMSGHIERVAWIVLLAGIIVSGVALAGFSNQKDNIRDSLVPMVRVSKGNKDFRFNDLGGEVLIEWPGGAFSIDKYEYPDEPGVRPVGGVSPERARSLCKERGKRLCRPQEWATACMAGSYNYSFYRTADEDEDKLANRDCGNRRGGDVMPSGYWKDCRNPYNVHDMIGNMWELVDLPEESGFVGIMGQGASSDQGAFNNCEWIAIIFKNQFETLPAKQIGFRCCGGDIYPDEGSR